MCHIGVKCWTWEFGSGEDYTNYSLNHLRTLLGLVESLYVFAIKWQPEVRGADQ